VLWFLRGSILGWPQARWRARLRALVLGNYTVSRSPSDCTWESSTHLRVRFHPFLLRFLINATCSLWTKYTVAGTPMTKHRLAIIWWLLLAIPGSFIFTMLFLPLYAVVAPAIGFSTEYAGIVPRLWSNSVFYFILILVPLVCLVRDFTWK
jgi:hypothetical protein